MQTLTKYTGNDANVRVPSSVESIGYEAFANNTNIRNVFIPDTVTDLNYGVFNRCVNLKKVRIPSNIEYIPVDMFNRCTNLLEVTVPDKVIRISNGAFRNCSSLKSINLPDGVEWIKSEAFSGCTSLINVNLNNVKWIDDYAFAYCSSLREITIPETVTSIAVGAFKGCKNLVSVKCLSNIEINRNVFEGCDKLDISNIKFMQGSVFDDSYEDESESEMTFQDWYGSDKCIDDQNEFIWGLESKVRSAYDVAEWFAEPSTQGLMGSDDILVTLTSGDQYSFSFDFKNEQHTIYSEGPEEAAKYYFKQIKKGIDSGSALVEDVTML